MDAAAKALPAGTLVTLRRADERPFGVATFNPHTLIAARLLDRDAGRAVDRRFFARRLERALRLRERLYDAPYYRLVHAEADGLPGLVVDRFGGVLVVQANTAGMDRLLPVITDALQGLLPPEAIVLRNDSPARTLEGLPLETRTAFGTLEGPVSLDENGTLFLADVLAGQKTGWFYDQRDNRALRRRAWRPAPACSTCIAMPAGLRSLAAHAGRRLGARHRPLRARAGAGGRGGKPQRGRRNLRVPPCGGVRRGGGIDRAGRAVRHRDRRPAALCARRSGTCRRRCAATASWHGWRRN